MTDRQSSVCNGSCKRSGIFGRYTGSLLFAIMCLPGATTVEGAQPSDVLMLRGVIRDFQSDHPDFAITEASAMGHTARTVSQTIGLDGLPRYVGIGLEVHDQWFDKDSNPIMPYGDPGLFGGHFDVDVYNRPTTSELYHEHEYDDKFDLTYIDIANDPRLLCDDLLGDAYPNPVRIEFVNPHNGGGGTFVFEDPTGVVNGLTSDGFTREVLPSEIFQLRVNFETLTGMRQTDPGTSQGDVVDRDDSFSVRMHDTVTGELVYECTAYEHVKTAKKGKKGKVDESVSAGPTSIPPKVGNDTCGAALNDSTGAYGANATGAMTNAMSFGQWFRSVPGVNVAEPHWITLSRDSGGVYEYADESFFPIEELGYGKQGNTNNCNFTYAITASFNYRACQGQFFEFEGNDDAWLFINDELVMDLGGLATPSRQYVALDRLGLVDGESFVMSFFYANRRDVPDSVFRLRIKAEVVARVYSVVSNPFFD